MKLKIKLDKSRKKKDGHPLIVSIYISKQDYKYPFSGYYSTAEHWDFDKEEPKPTHELYTAIMGYILETKTKILKIINSRQSYTSEQIYNIIFGSDQDLYAFWQLRIDEFKAEKRTGHAEFNENTMKLFQQFSAKLNFDQVTYQFLYKFKMYKSKTCVDNTINNYLRGLRAIYNEAIKRGVYIPENFKSPFLGAMPKLTKTKDKYFTLEEMKTIVNAETKHRFYPFFIISFMLGGLDFIDLAGIKEEHVRHGRTYFPRFKGGTNEIINNFIFPEVQQILDEYADPESEYLLPIHKYSYKSYRKNFVEDFRVWLESIGVTSYFSTKTARYTFINIGKQLMLNRDVVMELTGHARSDVHSIYEGKFPDHVKDEVHRKIIDAVFEK